MEDYLKTRLLCIGGPRDGEYMESFGNEKVLFRSPAILDTEFYQTPPRSNTANRIDSTNDFVYKRKTIGDSNYCTHILVPDEWDSVMILQKLLEGYRVGVNV